MIFFFFTLQLKWIIIHFNATDTQGRSSEQNQQDWKQRDAFIQKT